jgi:hypothetical protein
MCVVTVSKTITQWADNIVTQQGIFDPTFTIEYKIKDIDIIDNAAGCSSTLPVIGYTVSPSSGLSR